MNDKIDEERKFKAMVAEAYKCSDEAWDKIEKETDWDQAQKEAIESSRDYYRSIPMYDWATKRKSNMQDMMDKYGSAIVYKIRDCERDGVLIPRMLISDMHRIDEGKVPYKRKTKPKKSNPPAPAKHRITEYPSRDDKKESVPKVYEDRYANIKSGIFNVARNKESLKGPVTLLLYLIQEKAWDGKKDKHKTWDHWYLEKNLIVSTRSVDQMAADLGVHRGTIVRWSVALEKDGLIVKRKVGLETIYILGKVVNGKDQYFYCGDIEPDKSESK